MSTSAHASVRITIHDGEGRELRARVDLWLLGGDRAAVLFHSRGGTRGSAGETNPDYIPAYELVLARLAALEGTITDAYLNSTKHVNRIREERRFGELPLSLAG